MILPYQLLILCVSLIMMYSAFIYYKRGDIDLFSAVFWLTLWLALIIISLAPPLTLLSSKLLGTLRPLDALTILGFLLFSIIMFHMYSWLSKMKKQLNEVVREIALSKLSNPKHLRNKNK